MPTAKPLPHPNVFHIDFSTKNSAGYIKAVKVTVEEDVVDLDEVVRIDLRDHPLYPALFKYCRNNPPIE